MAEAQQTFGKPDPMEQALGGPRTASERTVRPFQLLGRVGAKAVYTYDFGDSWTIKSWLRNVWRLNPGALIPCA